MKIRTFVCRLLAVTAFVLFIPNTYAQSIHSDIDSVAQVFMDDNVPDKAEHIENTITINANRGSDSILNKVEAKAYTFIVENNVYTVVDFYSTEKIKTSENDIFTITTGDSLLPLEAIDGKLYIKNKLNDEWEFSNRLDTMSGLHGFELYGTQIKNSKPYIRILLCFRSEKNMDAENVIPQYVINFNQEDSFTIPLIPVILISFLVVLLVVSSIRKAHKLQSIKR